MEVMLLVGSAAGGRIAASLGPALGRAGARWGAFFTGDGVLALRRPEVVAAMAGAERAVACEHSWHARGGSAGCPVEAGSQVANSEMLGEARRVVSL